MIQVIFLIQRHREKGTNYLKFLSICCLFNTLTKQAPYFVVCFDAIHPSQQFQSCQDLLSSTSTKQWMGCLAEEHNTVTPPAVSLTNNPSILSLRLYQLSHCPLSWFCWIYSKTCLKRPLKKDQKIGFQDRILLNAGQKYCRMLQREHSAILSTFIKLLFTIKTFVLSIFK